MAPEQSGDILMARLALIITVLVSIFFGSGPASCGYAYVLRNMAREEHTWVFSDFFQKFKEGFWRGLLYFVVDVIVGALIEEYCRISRLKGRYSQLH